MTDTVIYRNQIDLSTTILSNLIFSNDYRDKVFPHLKEEYFGNAAAQCAFKLIKTHVEKYNKSPTKEMLLVELNGRSGIIDSEWLYQETTKFIAEQLNENQQDLQWLIDTTEHWCKQKAMFGALYKSIEIAEDKTGKKELSAIPPMMQDALSVSFQTRNNMAISNLLDNYIPPEYLIDNLFKRGYLYSTTGLTGSGKTAVALSLAMHVATNTNMGNREVKGGRVVYFAGENPDDVIQRLIGMTDGIDVSAINLLVMPNASRKKAELAIAELIADRQEIALVVVDTSTAYFAGEDENDNKAALEHAKWLRSISTRVPGNPTILVACHPIKNAADDNLLPRGGGAFLNEVDGNLACIKKGDLTVVSQFGKYRDVYFPAISFLRFVKYCERLKTLSGKQMPTVIAHLATEQETAEHEFQVKNEDMQVLELLAEDTAISLRPIANKLLWLLKNGEPDQKKVQRVIRRLQDGRMLDENKQLTDLGRKKLDIHSPNLRNGGNGMDHNVVRGLFAKGTNE